MNNNNNSNTPTDVSWDLLRMLNNELKITQTQLKECKEQNTSLSRQIEQLEKQVDENAKLINEMSEDCSRRICPSAEELTRMKKQFQGNTMQSMCQIVLLQQECAFLEASEKQARVLHSEAKKQLKECETETEKALIQHRDTEKLAISHAEKTATAMMDCEKMGSELKIAEENVANSEAELKEANAQLQILKERLEASIAERKDAENTSLEVEKQLQDSLNKMEHHKKAHMSIEKQLEEVNWSGEKKFTAFEKRISEYEQYDAPDWKTSEPAATDIDVESALPRSIERLCEGRTPWYFPGLLKFCTKSRAAFIVRPTYTYTSRGSVYFVASDSRPYNYVREQELFHHCEDNVYYLGTYRCLGDGESLSRQRYTNHIRSTLDAVLHKTMECSKTLYPLFKDAYETGILRVELFGFQCVGFNQKLYDAIVAARRKRMHEEQDEDHDELTSDGSSVSKRAKTLED